MATHIYKHVRPLGIFDQSLDAGADLAGFLLGT
jgi:hypothetical protein